jgi:cytochrome c oxidase subunit IV
MSAETDVRIMEEHQEAGGRLYFSVWFALLALTACEVVLAYTQVLSLKGMLIVLMALSIVKAGLIVAYFMHLRFERVNLALSLIPSVVVVICLLFVFFPDSLRLLELRVP